MFSPHAEVSIYKIRCRAVPFRLDGLQIEMADFDEAIADLQKRKRTNAMRCCNAILFVIHSDRDRAGVEKNNDI